MLALLGGLGVAVRAPGLDFHLLMALDALSVESRFEPGAIVGRLVFGGVAARALGGP